MNLPINPDKNSLDSLMSIAEIAVKSKLLPASVTTKEQAFIIGLKGMELGLSFMAAVNYINVIKGKPCISAEGMLALIYRAHPNASITFSELTDSKCEIEAARPGSKPSKFSFSIDDAKRAQLTSNPSWSKYPKDMLKARAVSQMARSLFPDVLLGASYTPEEMLSVDEDRKPRPTKTVSEEPPREAHSLPPGDIEWPDETPSDFNRDSADDLPLFDDEPPFEIPAPQISKPSMPKAKAPIPNYAPQSKAEAENAVSGPARALLDLARTRAIPHEVVSVHIKQLTGKTRSTELTAPEVMKVINALQSKYPEAQV